MVDGGPRLRALMALRDVIAVPYNGVGLSIVSATLPAAEYLRRSGRWVEQYRLH